MNRPCFRHQSGRMFENRILEACSKVHPRTPFLVYVPLTTGIFAWSLYAGKSTPGYSALFVPLGVLVWCVMEYCLHRYIFHWEGNGPFTRRMHEILHGYHHKYPDDARRLVMPLGASIPLSIVIGGLLWLVNRPVATIPCFLGIAWGYLCYDYIHWATHHLTPRTAWGKALRSHHLTHHFATAERNFGISNTWVDILVGSGGHGQNRTEPCEAGETPPSGRP